MRSIEIDRIADAQTNTDESVSSQVVPNAAESPAAPLLIRLTPKGLTVTDPSGTELLLDANQYFVETPFHCRAPDSFGEPTLQPAVRSDAPFSSADESKSPTSSNQE